MGLGQRIVLKRWKQAFQQSRRSPDMHPLPSFAHFLFTKNVLLSSRVFFLFAQFSAAVPLLFSWYAALSFLRTCVFLFCFVLFFKAKSLISCAIGSHQQLSCLPACFYPALFVCSRDTPSARDRLPSQLSSGGGKRLARSLSVYIPRSQKTPVGHHRSSKTPVVKSNRRVLMSPKDARKYSRGAFFGWFGRFYSYYFSD